MVFRVIGFWGGYPAKGEAASCYLLEEKGYHLLLDCGSGALSRLPEYCPPGEIDSIVISHYHGDHFSDLECFFHASLVETSLGLRKRKLFVYGPSDPENPIRLSYPGAAEGKTFNHHDKLQLGPFSLSFFANIHPCLSFSIKVETGRSSLVYTGDTGWHDGLPGFCRKADILVCESSLYNTAYRKVEGHLTAGETGKLAVRAQVGLLLLTHLPHYGDHQDLIVQSREGAQRERENQKKQESPTGIAAVQEKDFNVPKIELAREGYCWEDRF
ncbi:MAG: MBL fold metallo-hydrolase [Treponema sp.]|jgi:ribonuclease BN (tRNA processing enzyme)|nr:MBL fold metallo-hydrolase [Treponema sp.]